MLSRIAEALYDTGRDIERAQYVVRILAVQHKMLLALPTWSVSMGWLPFYEAFEVSLENEPTEEGIYSVLVLSRDHPYSARARITQARERGRSLRETISEEMWEHLNRFYHELAPLRFDDIRQLGREEFNRRVGVFCDAFFGISNDTMIHGPEVSFLQLGKFVERASMLCRILDIKRKSLEIAPEELGRPIDFRQWQSMLRCLSGFEPYRRVYDARIIPSRVLDFVLLHSEFPRSFLYCLHQIREALEAVSSNRHLSLPLLVEVSDTVEQLESESGNTLLRGDLEAHVTALAKRCLAIDEGIRSSFFRSQLPAPQAIRTSIAASLQGQVQQ